MPQLICKNVTLGYEGVAVTENLNFQVSRGDYLCIVGENGAGKSTLIKALLGLKSPMAGEIITGDGLKSDAIGYLPQQTLVQRDFPASVKEIVYSGLLGKLGKKPFFTKNLKAAAKLQMEKLGISSLENKCYRELSGGQQQRVLLARALCAAEKMILLDEPVAGLDPAVKHEMYELIKKLNEEEQITVIMVTHDIPAAVKYASHILHIGHTPLFFGETDKYVNSSVGKAFTGSIGGEA